MKYASTLYRGIAATGAVLVAGKPLPPRHDLRNHSPDGFAWGYGGSGPAQLALALLADLTEDDAKAQAMYQPFKWRVVAALPQGKDWQLTGAQIRDVIEVLEIEARRGA